MSQNFPNALSFFEKFEDHETKNSGLDVVSMLLKQSKKKRTMIGPIIFMILSLAKALAPSFYRLYNGKPFFSDNVPMAFFPMFVTFMFFSMTVITLYVGAYDTFGRYY